MKRPVLSSVVLLLALALPGLAAATDYTVQPAASKLAFSGSFQGETFNGHFDKWTAAIRYDPADLTHAAFDVTVNLASVKTGDSDRDSALPGSDFFDVAKFPTAHFVSTGFRRSGGQVIADGKLTLRGVTRPASLDVTFQPSAGGATLDVDGVVHRLDFGVGGGEYADTSVIGADVKVTAHLQLTAK